MEKGQFRIVFMGTPEFAEYSLNRLMSGGYNVVAVVTMADKPVGRHRSIMQESPVKRLAVSLGIPVLQPDNLKNQDFLNRLSSFKAQLQIVVAFRMLPEVVWEMPEYGTINLHASLLPLYRGAAPINWALINGEKETGVTTFFIRRDIDTGDIISQKSVVVQTDDTAATLHDKLMIEGAELLLETVGQIVEGRVNKTSQCDIMAEKDVSLKLAPKIFKETCRISWTKSMVQVYDFIRGFSPYPAAWTELHTAEGDILEFKIIQAIQLEGVVELEPGQIKTYGNKYLDVAGLDGYIRLLTIQPAGKKRMQVESFLCGNRLSEDDFFK